MNALILIAHGSRLETSNQEFMDLVMKIRQTVGDQFSQVEGCFLEIAQPTLEALTATLVEQGIKQVDIYPYFLSAGRHVERDIPLLINNISTAHPELVIKVHPHLGKAAELPGLVLNQINWR